MEVSSQRNMEMRLQNLRGAVERSNYLEQYPTDPRTAANILNLAFLDGNIESKTIADLGSGNGLFGFGALMYGATRSYCVEIDSNLISIIRENTEGLNAEIVNMDVRDFSQRTNTTIMNPPFGSVRKHADRPFMEKAVELSDYVYAIHNSKSREYAENFYSANGEIFRVYDTKIQIPRLFSHHTKDRALIPSTVFCVRIH